MCKNKKERIIVSTLEINNQTLYSDNKHPVSSSDAFERLKRLRIKITAIKFQMFKRDSEHKAWRNGAQVAQNYAEIEVAFLRKFIHERFNQIVTSDSVIKDNDASMLREVFKILYNIKDVGILTPNDHQILKAVGERVLTKTDEENG